MTVMRYIYLCKPLVLLGNGSVPVLNLVKHYAIKKWLWGGIVPTVMTLALDGDEWSA
jgi:hypothetical protein